MAANLQFRADIDRFAKLLNDRVDVVMNAVAVALHSKLGEVTPYRTGRARASWNISTAGPDTKPAPELPFKFADEFRPTAGELARANAFYDPIFDRKNKFEAPPGVIEIWIANNVHYIENLNAGSSKQAPAGFFEATVAGLEAIVNAQIAKFAA